MSWLPSRCQEGPVPGAGEGFSRSSLDFKLGRMAAAPQPYMVTPWPGQLVETLCASVFESVSETTWQDNCL